MNVSIVLRRCLPLLFCALLVVHAAGAEPVEARLKQGSGHIFLVLLGEDGNTLAAGESIQTVKGDTVTARTTFHFRDGSLDEETTVFEQSKNFRLLSDRRLQRGPAFPHPMETQIDTESGQVTMRDPETGKTSTETLKLPPDLANGLISQILQNLPPDTAEIKVSYLLPIGKPRLATLAISRAGEDTYSLCGIPGTAKKFEVKVELGGLAGLFAGVMGKQAKPTTAWMAGGDVPMFIRIQTQFYAGAPLWTIQQTVPVWPSEEK